jgi:polycystin 1L2
MTQVNGFTGFVGYSLRELDSNETNLYCSNTNIKQTMPMSEMKNRSLFTSDFMIRTYTSGCYYFDVSTGKWSPDGMEIYEDTNLEYTHCASNHLTDFAGGLVLTPSVINYQYAFANMSFTRSPTIFITMIVLVCLYVLFALVAILLDVRDAKKMGIYVLKDNFSNDSYFYELMVFTGNRSESGTNSIVSFNALN